MNAKKKKKARKKKKLIRAEEPTEQFSQPFSNFSSEIFAEDIAFLLRSSPASLASPEAATEYVVRSIIPTFEMAEDPEFEQIIDEPVFCASSVREAAEQMDINFESFESLPEAVAESIRYQIREEVIKKIMDDPFREKLLERLNKYRLRKKRKGKKMEAAKAAAVMLTIKEKKNEAIWPKIGLLQGLVHHGAIIGNEILGFLEIIMSGATDGHEQINSKIKSNPKLGKFLLKEIGKRVAEGERALLSGNLHLGVYDGAEIERAAEVFANAIKAGEITRSKKDADAFFGFTEEGKNRVAAGLEEIVDDVITKERIDEAHKKIIEKLNEKGEHQRWKLFLLDLSAKFKQTPALEKLKNFFIVALFGEAGIGSEPDKSQT